MALAFSAGADNAVAQTYPGLSSGSSLQSKDAGQAPQGYGGLTTPKAPMKAPVRRKIGAETQETSKEAIDPTADRQDIQDRAENDRQASIRQQQSFAQGASMAPPVQNEADLKMAAVIEQNAKVLRETVLPTPKLGGRTLAVLNTPQQKVDGMWPSEKRAVSYIQMAFTDIKNTPPAQKRDKIRNVKRQIESMMDANLVRLATDDAVSLKMGISQQAVDQNKAAAAATNQRLQQALSKLR